MKLVFATNNRHKLDEVRKITAGYTEIASLSDIDCQDDIPETADTLEGNALQKARYIKEHFGYDCFADDTGLEVEALDNAPGVYSARYAGPGHDSEANMNKLLHEMEGKENRKARFRTSRKKEPIYIFLKLIIFIQITAKSQVLKNRDCR